MDRRGAYASRALPTLQWSRGAQDVGAPWSPARRFTEFRANADCQKGCRACRRSPQCVRTGDHLSGRVGTLGIGGEFVVAAAEVLHEGESAAATGAHSGQEHRTGL